MKGCLGGVDGKTPLRVDQTSHLRLRAVSSPVCQAASQGRATQIRCHPNSAFNVRECMRKAKYIYRSCRITGMSVEVCREVKDHSETDIDAWCRFYASYNEFVQTLAIYSAFPSLSKPPIFARTPCGPPCISSASSKPTAIFPVPAQRRSRLAAPHGSVAVPPYRKTTDPTRAPCRRSTPHTPPSPPNRIHLRLSAPSPCR